MTTELTPVFNPPLPIRLLTPGAQQFALAILARAIQTPRYIADVFVYWHAHCNSLRADVHVGGWKKDSTDQHFDFDFCFEAGSEGARYVDQPYERFCKLLDRLEAENATNPEREKLIADTKAAELRAQAAKLLAEAEKLSPLPNPVPAFDDDLSVDD